MRARLEQRSTRPRARCERRLDERHRTSDGASERHAPRRNATGASRARAGRVTLQERSHFCRGGVGRGESRRLNKAAYRVVLLDQSG